MLMIAIAAVGALVQIGFSAYTYFDGKDRAEKQETKNKELMAEQERRAKVMQLKEFNHALAAYNKGTLTAKMELLKEERKAANHGTPVTTA